MTTAMTRHIVEEFVAARAAADRDAVAALLAHDVVLVPPPSTGFGPFQGRDQVVDALAGGVVGKVLDVATIRRTLHRILADDDMAVVLNRLEALTRDGQPYANEYCFVFTCHGGVISRIVEFADTLHADAVFHFASL